MDHTQVKHILDLAKTHKRHQFVQILTDSLYLPETQFLEKHNKVSREGYVAIKNLNSTIGGSEITNIYDQYKTFQNMREGGGSGSKSKKSGKKPPKRKNSKSGSKKYKFKELAESVASTLSKDDVDGIKTLAATTLINTAASTLPTGQIIKTYKQALNGINTTIETAITTGNPETVRTVYESTKNEVQKLNKLYNQLTELL
jgi:hypothetical protein